MNDIFFCIGCGMILCAIAGAFLLRWYLVVYTKRLIHCLDEMIAGKNDLMIGEEEELLMAKVEVRLRQLYEILRQEKEQSQRDRESLESTISDISHQVKTPMTNIHICQELLSRDNLPLEHRREFLQQMETQVNRLNALMESMIKMSRLEVGIMQMAPALQNVSHLIEEAVCQIALKANEKQIQVKATCASGLKAVFDKKWTIEALGNILDNGIKYAPVGGSMTITADTTDFFVQIRVADTGKGIPEAHYTKIFKRFYREEDVQQEEGIGLGLFLAQKIIRQQNGYIDVKSQLGEGSVFSIYLPVEA